MFCGSFNCYKVVLPYLDVIWVLVSNPIPSVSRLVTLILLKKAAVCNATMPP